MYVNKASKININKGFDKGRTIRSPGRGVGSFFVQDFFLVALGLQDFFLANAGIFLVVALLHDFFLLLVCLARFFFW